MNTKKILSLFLILFVASTNLNAQNVWGQILNGLVQGAAKGVELGTLKNIINNPSLQSADMKNFLAKYRNGDAYMSKGDYKNAAECYAGAWLIANKTRDVYLQKLWTDYGWGKDTTLKVENACSLAGIQLNSSSGNYSGGYNSGLSNGYSSGSSSSSSSNQSRVCSLCHGTGMKITEHYGAGQRKYCSICGKTVSTGHMHVRCDMCNGTGRLNY